MKHVSWTALVLAQLACGPAPEPAPDRFLFPTGVYELTISKATDSCAPQQERSTPLLIPVNLSQSDSVAIITFVFYRYDTDLQRTVTEINYQDFAFADPNHPSKDWSTTSAECGEVEVAVTHKLGANEGDGFSWTESREVTTATPCDHEAALATCDGATTYTYALEQACGEGCEAQLLQTSSDPLVRGRCEC